MAGLLVGLVVVACMGVAVAANLAAYAQRHWVKRPVVAGAASRWNYSVGRLGDVAGFGEQLREAPARYGYADARRAA